MERLLCLWIYHRYRYGLHTRRILGPSDRRNFFGQHLPRALGTVPSWSGLRKLRQPCQQKNDRVLSSVISQRWTLYGRILAGTLCVDKWNSISEGLHGCDDEKQQQQQEEQISQKNKTKTEQPIKTTATKQLNTHPPSAPSPPPHPPSPL